VIEVRPEQHVRVLECRIRALHDPDDIPGELFGHHFEAVVDGNRDFRGERQGGQRLALRGPCGDVRKFRVRSREQRFEERLIRRELWRHGRVRALHGCQIRRRQRRPTASTETSPCDRSRTSSGQLQLRLLDGLAGLLQRFLRLRERLFGGRRHGRGRKSDRRLRAMRVDAGNGAATAPESAHRRVRDPDNQLVPDVPALIVGRLTITNELGAVERERLLAAGARREGHVAAVLECPRLAARTCERHRRIARDPVAPQPDVLEVSPLVAPRLDAPRAQAFGDVRGRQAIAFTEDLPALQRVGRQVGEPLLQVGLSDLGVPCFRGFGCLCDQRPGLPEKRRDGE
jgi:hypothetical protein